MAHAGNDPTAIPDAASLREVLARFQEPLPYVARRQIITTILPLIATYKNAGSRTQNCGRPVPVVVRTGTATIVAISPSGNTTIASAYHESVTHTGGLTAQESASTHLSTGGEPAPMRASDADIQCAAFDSTRAELASNQHIRLAMKPSRPWRVHLASFPEPSWTSPR